MIGRVYNTYPKQLYSSPLEPGDHPELDDTELLDDDGIRQYHSLIGSLQWAISLGRFDTYSLFKTKDSLQGF